MKILAVLLLPLLVGNTGAANWSFVSFSDAGTKTEPRFEGISKAVAGNAFRPDPDFPAPAFILGPGDMANWWAYGPQMDVAGVNIPLILVRGNHDGGHNMAHWCGTHKPELLHPLVCHDAIKDWVVSTGPYWNPDYPRDEFAYAFEYNNALFVAIDFYASKKVNKDLGGFDDAQKNWVTEVFNNSNKPIRFLTGHPPYEGLRREKRNVRAIWDIAKQNNCLAYINGHSHKFSVSLQEGMWQLDNGQYASETRDPNSRWDVTYVWVRDHKVVVYKTEIPPDGRVQLLDQWTIQEGSVNIAQFSEGMGHLKLRVIPNPFMQSTWLHFNVPMDEKVTLNILAASGRLVRNLAASRRFVRNGRMLWDGTDNAGKSVAPGTYYASLRTRNVSKQVPLILME